MNIFLVYFYSICDKHDVRKIRFGIHPHKILLMKSLIHNVTKMITYNLTYFKIQSQANTDIGVYICCSYSLHSYLFVIKILNKKTRTRGLIFCSFFKTKTVCLLLKYNVYKHKVYRYF